MSVASGEPTSESSPSLNTQKEESSTKAKTDTGIVLPAVIILVVLFLIGLVTYYQQHENRSLLGIAIGDSIQSAIQKQPKLSLQITSKEVHVYRADGLDVDIGRNDQTVHGISYTCKPSDLAVMDGIPCGATTQAVTGKYGTNIVSVYCKRDTDGNKVTMYYDTKAAGGLVFRVMDDTVIGFDIARSVAFNDDWTKDHKCE